MKEHERNSGLELIKILAILLIILDHVVGTLTHLAFRQNISIMGRNDYIIDISTTSNNIRNVILACMTMLGSLGNTIFFACSSWFLIKSQKVNIRKFFEIIADIWFINFVILIIFCIFKDVSKKLIFVSLFPTIYGLNWYMTVYLMVYSIHTVLNKIIFSFSQKKLLMVNLLLFIMYSVINYFFGQHFFPNQVTYFICIYFYIAYIRLYLNSFCNNKLLNIILLAIGLTSPILLTFITYYLGLRIDYFSTFEHWFRWSGMNSPFMIITAIALINFSQMKTYYNRLINYISGCSMLIYIIHENHFIVDYIRPLIWIYIYDNYGYDYIYLWVFIYSGVLFVISAILSIFYKIVLQKHVKRLGAFFEYIFCITLEKITNLLLRIK